MGLELKSDIEKFIKFEDVTHKLSFITYILGGYLVESYENIIEVNSLKGVK
jgi:hypothetical protein